VCVAGSCSCTTPGQTFCGSACTDTNTDPKNCGGCAGAGGQVCPSSAPACVQGNCTCPSTYTVCGSACVDLATDPNNCGTCGQACPSGYVCGGQPSACGGITVCQNTSVMCALQNEVCDGYNRCSMNCCTGTCGAVIGGGTTWYRLCGP
jgi:hypothetical protein